MEKQKSFEDATMVDTTSSSSNNMTHTNIAPNDTEKTKMTTSSASLSQDSAHHRTTDDLSSLHSGFKSKGSKKGKHISVKDGFMTIVKSSWVNVLLIFVPIGIASHFVWSPTITFIMNFLAIIPLAKLLGFATEDIALRTGEVSIALKRSFIRE